MRKLSIGDASNLSAFYEILPLDFARSFAKLSCLSQIISEIYIGAESMAPSAGANSINALNWPIKNQVK